MADTRLVLVEDADTAGAATVFDDPAIGTITFTCSGGGNFSVFGTLPATATPGSIKVMGHDMVDDMPVGGATILQPNPGAPGGGVGFGGANNILGEGIYYDTATKRLSLQWHVNTGSTCSLRGELVITEKVAGSGVPRPGPGASKAVCTVSGAATCEAD